MFANGKLIEDLNMLDGKRKAQLVRSNKYSPNSGSNWVDERVSLECASG